MEINICFSQLCIFDFYSGGRKYLAARVTVLQGAKYHWLNINEKRKGEDQGEKQALSPMVIAGGRACWR